MKRIYTLIAVLCATVASFAQSSGWPANYGGVMFQSFYWDSYSDTQWTNLTEQSDTLSKYFDLIWVPQSGWTKSSRNMGYYPIYWFNQRSAFGTEAQLRTMIKTFKDKGTGIIADVVINHKNGASSWADFIDEKVTGQNTGKTYSVSWDHTNYSQICSDDEANTDSKSPVKGKVKGNKDTGDGDGGCRDLDHTNATTQQNIETYLDFLLNEMGYTGFRYDMTKGYAPKYTKMYNESAKPQFSVGEYWDSNVTKVKSWIDGTGKTSAAFDFPMKYFIKNAFGGAWSYLKNYASSTLAGNSDYAQYAVTFVDNHDTGEPHANADPQRANIAAANAYILAMPGTPCIWISHWKSYKTIIKKCILARKIAGITNTSKIIGSTTDYGGYALTVEGSNGNVLLLLGGAKAPTDGYQLAVEGDNFKYYVADGLDISSIKSIPEEEKETHEIPGFCTVNEGETCAFFEVPASWGNVSKINAWVWDAGGNYTGGKWPGRACEYLGQTSKGRKVYKWTWDGSYVGSHQTEPESIIFSANSGSPQQNDMTFKNGNYYGLNEVYGNVIENANGISTIKTNTVAKPSNVWYTLSGVRLQGKPTLKGIYINNGKKITVR